MLFWENLKIKTLSKKVALCQFERSREFIADNQKVSTALELTEFKFNCSFGHPYFETVKLKTLPILF
ncbi:MAG: hypothetical protein DSY83_11605 [Flavobacteriia bacterium]|nr:MAG: hypothetical protein DSY83_11605 [Flavobacteriia bacterium]